MPVLNEQMVIDSMEMIKKIYERIKKSPLDDIELVKEEKEEDEHYNEKILEYLRSLIKE